MNLVRSEDQVEVENRRSAPEEPRKDPARERGRRRTARLVGIGAVVTLVALVGFGVWGHMQRSADATSALDAQRKAVPVVRVMEAKAETGPRIVDLPGNMEAFDSATIYARATGYIASRNVDIGSKVHKGDVLAVIAAPDLDAQLQQAAAQLGQMQAQLVQARANVEQARSNVNLGKVTNARTSSLAAQGWETKQNADNTRLGLAGSTASLAGAEAGVTVAEANVKAQIATVQRLEELVGFEKVMAPFDGVVTARQIDTGSLVAADAASGTPLFSVQRNDVLRVQLYVPQQDYFGLKDGQDATVTVPELPGQTFHGRVARNASALAAGTRTLLTEVDVDNKDGTLTAGLYGIVHLEEPRVTPVILVPSEAVIFNKNGLSAAVLEDGHIHVHDLDLQADDGAQVEVRAGLKPGDKIVLSPPVNLTEGMPAKASS